MEDKVPVVSDWSRYLADPFAWIDTGFVEGTRNFADLTTDDVSDGDD